MKSVIMVLALAFTTSAFANEYQDQAPRKVGGVPAFMTIDLGHEGTVESCGSSEAYNNEPCVKVTGRSAVLRFLRSIRLGNNRGQQVDPGQIGGN